MFNWYPALVTLAVALPLMDLLQAKTGECAANKLVAVNACAVVSKTSLTPDETCKSEYNGARYRDRLTGEDLDIANGMKICECDGYKALANCFQKICPADEQAVYWFDAASQACQFVTENNLTSGPKNSPIFEVVNTTTSNQKNFAGSKLSVSSVLGFFGLAVAFF